MKILKIWNFPQKWRAKSSVSFIGFMFFHIRKFGERQKEDRGANKHDKIFRNNFYHEMVKKNKLKNDINQSS